MTKVVAPKGGWDVQPKPKHLLPLVPEAPKKIEKDQAITFELFSDPANAIGSPKYKFTMRRIDGQEDLRTVIQWSKNVTTVLTGMNVIQPKNKYQLVQQMCIGTAKSALDDMWSSHAKNTKEEALTRVGTNGFNLTAAQINGREEHQWHDDASFTKCIQHLIFNCAPQKVLQRVKRELKREMRKPADMNIRTYLVHLNRINNDEIPHLPPFGADQGLSEDELIDILLFGIPKSWHREMDRQGFDPILSRPHELVKFLEQIELAETHDKDSNKVQKKANKKGKASKNGDKSDSNYCMLHGNCNHSTDNCKTLKGKAQQMKDSYQKDGSSKNKSWSRKAEDSKKQASQDLKAFVKKSIKAGVKKEINSLNKKRKQEEDDDSFDLNAIEEELKDFDYSKMNISDDEFSV